MTPEHESAQAKVRKLAEQIRAISSSPVIHRNLDQIEALCMAFMGADEAPAGMEYGLTVYEARIFELLLKRIGHTVSRISLWYAFHQGDDNAGEIKVLDVMICRIRKKLIGTKYEGLIETSWGVGYRLKDPADFEAKAIAA